MKLYFIHLFLFIILSYIVPIYGYNGTSTRNCRIDGFNIFHISDSSCLQNENISISQGNPNDSFYTIFPVNDSLHYGLNGAFLMGAEIGDPLLNRFTTSPPYNRDHESLFSATYGSTKIPLAAALRYRYLDTYSDRFDDHWQQYSETTQQNMFNNKEGLAYEIFAGTACTIRKFDLSVSYDFYRYWHCTPYFFSPLYTEGHTIKPQLRYNGKHFRLSTSADFNPSSWYYNHQTPVEYNDIIINSCFDGDFLHFSHYSFSVGYDRTLTPSSFIKTGISRTDSIINAGANGTFYSNYESAFDLYASLRFRQQWHCSLSVAREYIPASRSYNFLQIDTLVTYKAISLKRNTIYAAIGWKYKLFYPLHISGWFHYNSDPLMEAVTFKQDSTVAITQTTSKQCVHSFFGLNSTYSITAGYFSCIVHPIMVFPCGKRDHVRFLTGKSLDIKLLLSTKNSNPTSASLTFSFKDKTTLNYLVSSSSINPDSIQTFNTPASQSLYASFRIPFILPFFRSVIRSTAFTTHIGPVRFAREQRQREHPRGNLIGPVIIAGFEGTLR
jgi:hypothetical protein